MEQVRTLPGIDAVSLFLMVPGSQALEQSALSGFRAHPTALPSLLLDNSEAGRAVLEKRAYSVPDVRKAPAEAALSNLLQAEGFLSYHAIPMLVDGQVKGVLGLFGRSSATFEREHLEFLAMVANRMAVALNQVALIESARREGHELGAAFDETLLCIAKALDLRDREPEGHAQRVTEFTLKLARQMGVPEGDLVHYRRGALLHDIGKMGIADAILLKSTPLSEDEWLIMKKHPLYAYQLLSFIPLLRPALDIPYCHHERWDGTGYPCQLAGEQIPLSARIFALADAWDAMGVDRPYRAGWPLDKIRQHIVKNSGSHFDPGVVAAFEQMYF